MLYGCGCGVVDNSNCLMTSTEIRLFWLPLSTMKCSGVPFTHIYEWKRWNFPSSGSSHSSDWIVVVVMVVVVSASMIYFLLLFSESESKSGSDSFSLSSTTNDVNSNLVQYLLQTDIQKRTEKIQWQIQTLHRYFSPGNPNRENQHILYSFIVLQCLQYKIHIGASDIQNPNPMTWISPKP
jgi:hypothetical protein